MDYRPIREKVHATVMLLKQAGLVRLSAGNISARADDGKIAITPSGVRYDLLQPDDIAIVNLNGERVDAPLKPSSETPMHIAIYKNLPDVGAICHTHSPFAISFAMAAREIPVVNLELFLCGAPIPVTEWACPGTARAGEVAVQVFTSRPGLRACLLRSHGLIAIGKNLDHAFELAYDAEVGMQTYYQAMQIGTPQEITREQIDEILRAYA
ncbi:MAG: class II aldolase/adducin family protein [Anaerolineae bacterium]|nr:class II aldolase/adducin family protein [Anaerolineae bacterium]